MSFGLLTAFMLFGTAPAQNPKPAELPVDLTITCTEETSEDRDPSEEMLDSPSDAPAEDISTDVKDSNDMPSTGCYAVMEPEILEVMPAEVETAAAPAPSRHCLGAVTGAAAGSAIGMAPPGDAEEMESRERAESLPCQPPAPVEARVAEMLEACQRAIAESCYAEAETFLYQALLLDPTCVAANALAEKLHDMARTAPPVEALEQAPSAEDPMGEEPAETAPTDAASPPEQTFQPSLPPVDPSIVNVLEKVLREK